MLNSYYPPNTDMGISNLRGITDICWRTMMEKQSGCTALSRMIVHVWWKV